MPRFVIDLGQRAVHGQPQAVALDTVGSVPFAEVGAQLRGGMQRGPELGRCAVEFRDC